jgi:hypothetical protein
MKTQFLNARRIQVICLLVISHIWAGSSVTAQIQSATNASTSSDYVCVQRGPHSKVWQWAVLQTNLSGAVRTNLHSYTEIATGLCYLQNGEYVDSVEQIDAVANGAQAIQGQHQVQWAANANTPGGAVQLTTPDNKQLLSTVFGLVYYDTSTGSNVMLTRLQDSTATIVAGSNTLIYTNAFSNLTADVRYTYRKAGLNQDIILRQQPPSPADYGMNPATTWLQVITEFFNPPAPEITTVTNNGVSDDCQLDFGDMKMGVGQAFLFQNDTSTVGGVPVAKSWTNIDDRTFLIEQVPYTSISNLLSSLHSSLIKPDKSRVRRTVLIDPPKPRRKASTIKPAHPVKLSKAMPKEAGLVLDYEILSSTNNFTLQGDTTYLVTGVVSVTGTLTIEGGTVVKYTNSGIVEISATNFVCQTAPYRPGVFTSMNDNSVGDTISGNTGTPSRGGSTDLYFGSLGASSLVFSNLRFSYAGSAILGLLTTIGSNSIEIWDCQFINCSNAFDGVAVYFASNPGFPINFYNVLFSQCNNALYGQDVLSSYGSFSVNNVTADQLGAFLTGGANNVCYATNSLFTAVTNLSYISFTNCYTNATNTGIYQTAIAGNYYLTNGSTNHNAGTTNIDFRLLADLQTKTTYPPNVIYTNATITTNLLLSQRAQRDNNGSTVDRGYHYDPIDYAISISVSNATVTVSNGTVLAMVGPVDPYSAAFNCTGTATSPNYMVSYNTVQEQADTNWGSGLFVVGYLGTSSAIHFRFTDWSVLAGQGGIIALGSARLLPFSAQDCQFYNGFINGGSRPFSFTNCLFQRMSIGLDDNYVTGISNAFYNNLFQEGEFGYQHWPGGADGIWAFRDNLFNQTVITSQFSASLDISSNNAYVTTNFGVLVPTNAFVILSNSPAFEIGTLGEYYYPTNLTNLIYAGSRSAAAAGLYHYTVTTNNVVEGTNMVSIGFHYVACGTNGLPLDSNGDGIPDYLEDFNGDGIVDDGETNWALAILSQPLSQTVYCGSNATFTVGADGVALIAYQWIFNGTNISGATTNSYTITNVQATNTGNYTVIVTNFSGSLTSSIAALSVVVLLVAPEEESGAENYTLPISGVSIVDAVAGTNPIQFSFWATNGVLGFGTTSGLTFIQGTNGSTTNLTVSGTLSNLNVALATLEYVPNTNFYGVDGLTIQAYDLGINGLETPLTNTASISLMLVPDPSSISNLVLWLEADAGVQTTGSSVTNWLDQSANTNHTNNAYQNNSNNAPKLVTNSLNGRPVVHFTASNSTFLTFQSNFLTNATAAEAFVVLRAVTNAPSGICCLWSFGVGNGTFYPAGVNGNGYNPGINDDFGSSEAWFVGNPPISITNYHLYNSVSQSNGWACWINGLMQFTTYANTPAFEYAKLGGSAIYPWYFDGDIAEVLIFKRALTAAERETVGIYLNQKYGCIAPSIPNTPTNLTAVTLSASQISLSWNSVLTNWDTSFSIERSTNGVTFSQVALIDENCSYIDTGLAAGTKYYYQVQAINYAGSSDFSNITNATTLATGTDLPLGNLSLWLKADAGCSSGNINLWVDQSTNGNNAIQITTNKQPMLVVDALNGRPVVHFTASNETFFTFQSNFLSSTTAAEAFVVLRAVTNAPSGICCLWSFGGSNGTLYPAGTNGNGYTPGINDDFGSSAERFVGNPSTTITNYHIYSSVSQTNEWTCWINGDMQFTTNENTPDFAYAELGESATYYWYFDGDIAEVLIFDRVLTGDENVTVGDYLFSKYNLYQYVTNTSSPTAPTNLTVTGVLPYQLNLNWIGTSSNETGFVIERKLDTNGTYAEIGSSGINYFSDITASPTNQYFYKVKAENYFGQSGYSGEASPPLVSLTLLSTNEYIMVDTTNLLAAQALDGEGYSINHVVISGLNTNNVLGTSTTSPFTNSWIPTFQETYFFAAFETDTAGNTGVSPILSETVYLVSNTNGIPDIIEVQDGGNPINPWTPPTGSMTAPNIYLQIPTNAVLE